MNLFDNYEVFVFDLDGLLIDSLDKLSSSLVGAVSKFANPHQVEVFEDYDRKNPGLSRFKKVDYFINTILNEKEFNPKLVLDEFDLLSLQARLSSPITPFLLKLYQRYSDKKWILLTNCDNNQLLSVADKFNLIDIFKDNLIGTPPSKSIRANKIKSENYDKKILSISDSESDCEVAKENGFDFLFIEEFSRGNLDWKVTNYYAIASLGDLLGNSMSAQLIK